MQADPLSGDGGRSSSSLATKLKERRLVLRAASSTGFAAGLRGGGGKTFELKLQLADGKGNKESTLAKWSVLLPAPAATISNDSGGRFAGRSAQGSVSAMKHPWHCRAARACACCSLACPSELELHSSCFESRFYNAAAFFRRRLLSNYWCPS
eukprot:COSAG05_NODE_3911_length_1777_cov_1.262813_2_plen_153_part_00